MSDTTWTPAMEAELRVLIRREYRAQQRRDAACRGKDKFSSPALARASMPRRHKVMVYRCQHCHAWHLGSHLGTKQIRERRPRETEDML